jgi:hypothetical protein
MPTVAQPQFQISGVQLVMEVPPLPLQATTIGLPIKLVSDQGRQATGRMHEAKGLSLSHLILQMEKQ